MALCKAKQIQNCCLPNALMTLEEYLVDYAAPATRELGEKLIQDNMVDITNPKVMEILKDRLVKIKEGGERDFRF